jgi:hypothetical protein
MKRLGRQCKVAKSNFPYVIFPIVETIRGLEYFALDADERDLLRSWSEGGGMGRFGLLLIILEMRNQENQLRYIWSKRCGRFSVVLMINWLKGRKHIFHGVS